jgi:hypothetical protein
VWMKKPEMPDIVKITPSNMRAASEAIVIGFPI